jgi:hypothetical protein
MYISSWRGRGNVAYTVPLPVVQKSVVVHLVHASMAAVPSEGEETVDQVSDHQVPLV